MTSLLKRIFSGSGKSGKKTSKAIGILGSGRCGTSMVTRAISFLGVDIGSEFVKKNKTNPKGFWENKDIVKIHKQIKSELGKRPFPDGWENKESIQPMKRELKELIEDQFLGKDLWGWKDPRTTESLAVWKEILRELDVSANYIIMVRNPIDVAASYQEAYNRKESRAIRQWQMRTLLALRGTNNENRIIIDYDELLAGSLETMRRVADTFELPWPEKEADLKKDLDSFIDPDLQHSRTTLEELESMEEVESDIKKLYRLCLEGAESQEFLQSASFASQIEELYRGVEERNF
ncbi:MAG TPA: sulfotransferase [Bacillales bacterium]|nr:sulfotransferase [Bacillales bacterium]